ncbi:MAG: Hsp20/alpha crystallin family protein [Verrucomicrobiales bacterium]
MKLARFNSSDLWNWPAVDQLQTLREEINRFFDLSDTGNSDALNTWAPALDIYEDKEALLVTAEIPGMKKEDISISLHEGVLTVAGERKNEKSYEGSQTSRSERFFGRFQRSISLPKKVDSDHVKATYKDGILTIHLPKTAEAKPRQIEVKTA